MLLMSAWYESWILIRNANKNKLPKNFYAEKDRISNRERKEEEEREEERMREKTQRMLCMLMI